MKYTNGSQSSHLDSKEPHETSESDIVDHCTSPIFFPERGSFHTIDSAAKTADSSGSFNNTRVEIMMRIMRTKKDAGLNLLPCLSCSSMHFHYMPAGRIQLIISIESNTQRRPIRVTSLQMCFDSSSTHSPR